MIGALDQRITFERATRSADGIGGTTRTWADLTTNPTVWANVVAKSGMEAMVNDRVTATFVSVFTIRNRSDITEKDRIDWGGVKYNIRGIRKEGAREEYLKIEAERGVQS